MVTSAKITAVLDQPASGVPARAADIDLTGDAGYAIDRHHPCAPLRPLRSNLRLDSGSREYRIALPLSDCLRASLSVPDLSTIAWVARWSAVIPSPYPIPFLTAQPVHEVGQVVGPLLGSLIPLTPMLPAA